MATARRQSPRGVPTGALVIARRHASAHTADLQRTFSCPQCEHVLHVSGLGRHRVFFELDDRRLDHPVSDRVCSQCGHGLPGKNPA